MDGICINFRADAGNSRVLYAAARDGRFFSIFAKVHPKDNFPTSRYSPSDVGCGFTFIPLPKVIASLMIIRSTCNSWAEHRLYLLRRNRRTCRALQMWLYPVPGIIALAGWLFIFFTARALLYLGGGFLISGTIAFLIHQKVRHEWPFELTRPELA